MLCLMNFNKLLVLIVIWLMCFAKSLALHKNSKPIRLAPVLKTIFHQCVISYTCSQSYSDDSVLRTGSTHTLPSNFLVGN